MLEGAVVFTAQLVKVGGQRGIIRDNPPRFQHWHPVLVGKPGRTSSAYGLVQIIA